MVNRLTPRSRGISRSSCPVSWWRRTFCWSIVQDSRIWLDHRRQWHIPLWLSYHSRTPGWRCITERLLNSQPHARYVVWVRFSLFDSDKNCRKSRQRMQRSCTASRHLDFCWKSLFHAKTTSGSRISVEMPNLTKIHITIRPSFEDFQYSDFYFQFWPGLLKS